MKNKKLPKIIVPASGKKDWSGGAFTIAFVYAKSGNMVVKGYHKEVEEYIQKNFTNYFVKYTLWSKNPLMRMSGNCRTIVDFWKEDIGIFCPSLRSRSKSSDKFKFIIKPYSCGFGKQLSKKELEEKTLKFKRLPNKWIPEFEIY